MRSMMLSSVMIVVMLASAGCTITTRSDNYACTGNLDCEALGRVCVNNWCVVPTCPDECSSCAADGSCVIECLELGACSGTVLCPDGRPCIVECGDGNCTGGVDCSNASTCDVTCSGSGSCSGDIVCGTGDCVVDCSGSLSCVGGVDCSSSCACLTTCAAEAACVGEHSCPHNNSCENGNTCDDAGNCNRC